MWLPMRATAMCRMSTLLEQRYAQLLQRPCVEGASISAAPQYQLLLAGYAPSAVWHAVGGMESQTMVSQSRMQLSGHRLRFIAFGKTGTWTAAPGLAASPRCRPPSVRCTASPRADCTLRCLAAQPSLWPPQACACKQSLTLEALQGTEASHAAQKTDANGCVKTQRDGASHHMGGQR